MGHRRKGNFSNNLFSLQMQVRTLLDGAGGDAAIELLDNLCELNKSERRVALKVFNRVVKRIQEGDFRLDTAEDKELKAFEENLYSEILHSFHSHDGPAARKFEVLPGGKSTDEEPAEDKTPINLSAFRKNRDADSSDDKPLLN
jgi:hypothetical protein